MSNGQGARTLSPQSDQSERIVLAGKPESARVARQFVRKHVMDSAPDATDDYVHTIVLVTSELVTNSIRYGTEPGDAFSLTLHTRHGRTRIEVRDPVRRHPQPRPESHKRDRGRGLIILNGLCHWGVDDAAFGKIVWADVIAK